MPLALLFDFDGTLFDTFDELLQAQNEAMAVFGEPPLDPTQLRPLIGIPLAKQLEITRGLKGARVEAINEEYYRRFQVAVEQGLRTYPGVPETLAALKDRRIGTVTTRRRTVADLMLRRAGIREYFTAVVGGDEVAHPKPEPDLVLHAAKSLGVPPARCAVVGDSPFDISAGKAAGARTIAATYGYGDRTALLAAKPDTTLDRFADLPRVVVTLEARKNP